MDALKCFATVWRSSRSPRFIDTRSRARCSSSWERANKGLGVDEGAELRRCVQLVLLSSKQIGPYRPCD